MKVSPLLTEFLTQSTIDKDNTTLPLPLRESCGWLLSPPVTATFSRKQVGNPLRSLQSGVEDTMESIKIERRRRAAACQVSSDDSPYRDSMLSDGSEDDNDDDDDWVMEDIFVPTTSGMGNSHSSYGSSTSQIEEEVWDPNIEIPSPEPFYKVNARSIRARAQGHVRSHGLSRRLPSQIQRELAESESFNQLHRTPAIRSPRRDSPAYIQPLSPPALRKVEYPAPPPPTPTKSESGNDNHTKWHSWPLQAAPLAPRPQLRTRANPTTINTRAAPGYNPQYVPAVNSAPPSSSHFPLSPEHDPMTFSETSAFSDDEDDDDDNDDEDACPFVLAMKRLQLSHGKSSTNGAAAGERERLPVEITGKKKTTPRRSFKRALTSFESFLKKKKGGTL